MATTEYYQAKIAALQAKIDAVETEIEVLKEREGGASWPTFPYTYPDCITNIPYSPIANSSQ